MMSLERLLTDANDTITKLGKSAWAMRRVFGNGQHLMLEDLHAIWGDQFRFPLGRRMATVLTDPQAIREMFEQGSEVLSAAESRKRLVGVLPPKSVPYQQGEAHTRARKALARAFAYTSEYFDVTPLLNDLMEQLQQDKSFEQNLVEFCYDLASKFVFGEVDHELGQKLNEAVDSAGAIQPFVLAFPVFRKLPGTAGQFHRLTSTRDAFLRVIDERLNAEESGFSAGSLASGLLKYGEELGMSREEVRDNLGMVAMATAFNLRIVLINVVHTLADSPEWQEKLRKAEDPSSLNFRWSASSLSRAMIKETLRLSPVVPLVSRMVKQDVVIGGTKFKAGEVLFASPWITHFRQASFENPHEYDPTRFLNGRQHGYNFIPFGGGSNHCLGSGWSIDLAAKFIRRLTSEFHLQSSEQDNSRGKFAYRVFNLVRRSFVAEVTALDDYSHSDSSCRVHQSLAA